MFTDIGSCICDLTLGSCDIDCACDKECTDEQRTLFSEILLPEGPRPFSIPVCVDPLLVKVNRRGDLITNVAGNLFCVAKHNNPSKGFFFSRPSPGNFPPVELAYLRENSPVVDPLSLLPSPPSTDSSTTVSSSYKSGARIRMAQRTPPTGTTYTLSAGSPEHFYSQAALSPHTSHFVGGSQLCGEHPLRFLQDSGAASCQIFAQDPVASCVDDGVFSASKLFSHFSVAKTPDAVLTTLASWRRIVVEVVQEYDETAGTYSDLFDIETHPDVVADPTIDRALIDYTFPSLSYDAATCECKNALLSASVRVEYSVNGEIHNVFVLAVIGTLSASIPGTPPTCGNLLTADQEWSVFHSPTFVPPSPPPTPPPTPPAFPIYERLSNGMLLQRVKSGNPGYISSYPLLAGLLSGGVVQQTLLGLPLLAFSPNHECHVLPSFVTPPATPTPRHVRVSRGLFGENSSNTCNLPMLLSDFQTLCASPQGVADYLQLPVSLLGIWGNSSSQNPKDWLEIASDAWPVTGGAFIASGNGGFCRGMVSSVVIDIYAAHFGSHSNPQNAIISAKAKYISGDVPFIMTSPTSGRMMISAVINFIQYPMDGLVEYIPSGPPTIVKLPSDFLYPFYVPVASSAIQSQVSLFFSLFSLLLTYIVFYQ